jgi:nucleoside-diphosphate-sugar epimerase
MSSQMQVVLGAGPLGRSVMNELVRRGAPVRVVNRSGKMADAPAGVEVVAGDVNSADSVRAVTQGAAVVYQCAQPEYHEWPQKFPPMMQAILAGLTGGGARLVIADNLYMVGPVKGPIHEDLPFAATTRKGKARAQVDELALAAHRAGQVPVTIGRASDFFGPYVLESLVGDRVFGPALQGKAAQLTGNIDLPHTFTYIGDFGKALVVLGEHDEALGRTWNVPNDRPQTTQRQFAEMIFAELGTPAKISRMGKTMIRLGGIFIPAAREVVEMMYEFDEPFVVDSSRFERTFGMQATPLPEAIRATVAWYKTHLAAQAV